MNPDNKLSISYDVYNWTSGAQTRNYDLSPEQKQLARERMACKGSAANIYKLNGKSIYLPRVVL